jgi:hypothetical protein
MLAVENKFISEYLRLMGWGRFDMNNKLTNNFIGHIENYENYKNRYINFTWTLSKRSVLGMDLRW